VHADAGAALGDAARANDSAVAATPVLADLYVGMSVTVVVAPHPLLEVGAFVTRLPRQLAEIPAPAAIAALCEPGAVAPMASSDEVRAAVRDLLRHGGFRPSGRSKPASEYLTAAYAEQRFPRINATVDACNAVSLWSGLPISLVDVDRLRGELAIRIAPAGTSYVFNPSGQIIDASGLVCLHDAEGPSGTPVKDAQRTKTHDGSQCVLSVVWGTRALSGRTADAVRWYRTLVAAIDGAEIDEVAIG
jgi:DNA/RNA-binding domain of Phe-tRNA-synthetase-like protein